MTRSEIDTADIQAIAKTAFDSLKYASYVLLRVGESDLARRWLRNLAPASILELSGGRVEEAYQIAFTAAGLLALGIDKTIVRGFSPEFVEGMAGDENRSRRLGDTGANAPAKWKWGVGEKEPHILLILFSSEAKQLEALVARMQKQANEAGLSVFEIMPASDMGGVEPFGFVDGVSQPGFDWDRVRTPGTAADLDFTHQTALV